jgi:hypothetical protein
VTGGIAVLFLIELGVRIATHSLFLLGVDSDRYVTVDPMIGRIPKQGVAIHHPAGFEVSIGEHGTRNNRNPPLRREWPAILAVGDSFTFGDQVNDSDSWPAVLERLLGRRVVNAGVPGFGLDQAVLRAEQLTQVYSPDTIVVSLIPHDVLRCQMSYWSGHPKPYFDINGTELMLHPAPERSGLHHAVLKRILSLSLTMDLLLPRFLHWEGPESVTVHARGRDVACRLMDRLRTFAGARNIRIVVLAQPQASAPEAEHLELKEGVLACARADGLPTLDLFPIVAGLPPKERAKLFDRHMTVEGNRLVAAELFALMNDSRDLPADGAPFTSPRVNSDH